MGVKIALSLVSSYASGGIDRNGQEISPMQVRRIRETRFEARRPKTAFN
jgi:hypothetical protein